MGHFLCKAGKSRAVAGFCAAGRSRKARALLAFTAFALCFMLLCLVFLWGFAAFLPPTAVFAAEAPPVVGAGAYIVMDAATGQVLVAKNEDQRGYPASITKVLTLALTLEHVDINSAQSISTMVSQAAVDALIPRASMVSLMSGEVASIKDLIYATKVESANDAANVLAEYISGSMDGFAQLMNEKTRQLGLSGSHFVNASGQPDDEHYTTASDMAQITRWALGVPGFRDVFAATRYSMPPTNRQPAGREFHDSNLILAPYSSVYCPGVTGSKTGYTDQASYTLVTTAQRGGVELICVVLSCAQSPEKYASTNQLLDYCFNNFSRISFPVEDTGQTQVPVYSQDAKLLGNIQVSGGGGEALFLLHRSLGLGAVQRRQEIPLRHIIGESFVPEITLSLPDTPQQKGGLLASIPLSYTGLDKIMAAYGGSTSPVAGKRPLQPAFLLLFCIPLLLLALVGARILYVKQRRKRRRLRRRAAALAQMPLRTQARPSQARGAQAAKGRPVRGQVYSRGSGKAATAYRRPVAQPYYKAAVGASPPQLPASAPRRTGRTH